MTLFSFIINTEITQKFTKKNRFYNNYFVILLNYDKFLLTIK